MKSGVDIYFISGENEGQRWTYQNLTQDQIKYRLNRLTQWYREESIIYVWMEGKRFLKNDYLELINTKTKS